MTDWLHKPGSDEARKLGCSCAVMDNAYGKGRWGDGDKYGWFVTVGCVVHSPALDEPNHLTNP